MNAHLPRFVEYGRVSSASQERRQTQEGQVVALERLRASRPGIPVLAEPVFEPRHVSAMEVPLSERSEWTRVNLGAGAACCISCRLATMACEVGSDLVRGMMMGVVALIGLRP